MLKDHSQLQLSLSPYQGLYDAIIPEDHLLRRIKENIDFSFVNPMLRKQYCENFGRPAKEPEMMFKLLFLKKLYDLSDEALISSAQTDMAYKFFLNLEPESKMIDPSLLTKFRKTRITEEILEELLKETIQQALDKKPDQIGNHYRRFHSYTCVCSGKIPNADSAGYEQTTPERDL